MVKNPSESHDNAMKHWHTIYNNIKCMRSHRNAPVDNYGAQKLYNQKLSSKDQRYQILIALMLSSQTKDGVTATVMEKIRKHDMNAKKFSIMEQDEIQKLIYPIGFYKLKSKYIKAASKLILEQYSGDIPKTLEDLQKLPGVGPKMAHLAMQLAWGETCGIAVDTHVHRISNRLALVPSITKTPEHTRKALESWLPREYWNEINHLLVGFGQQICTPRGPKCEQCLNQTICNYYKTAHMT